jgi:PD-(D/E)XK nuclease superfamily
MINRNIVMDSQLLNSLQLCGYRTDLYFNKNYRPNFKAEALEKGDLLHLIFKVFYTLQIKRPDIDYLTAVELAVKWGREHAIMNLALDVDTAEETVFQCVEYFKHFQGEYWTPTHVERPFAKIIYENENENLRIIYEGIIDLMVNTKVGEAIVDHKSASRNADSTYLGLSNQFKGYAYCMETTDVIINKVGFQKTLKPAERFKRIPISYEQATLDEWCQETIWWGQQLLFYIENNTWPMNHTSCDKYSGCIFNKACIHEPGESRNWMLQTEYIIGKKWSPQERDEEFDKKLNGLISGA